MLKRHRGNGLLSGLVAAIVLVALLGAVAVAAAVPAQTATPAAPDRIIVGFKTGVGVTQRNAVDARHGGHLNARLAKLGADVVGLPQGVSVSDALARYAADPNVAYAEPDYKVHATFVPNDPYFSSEWGMAAVSAPGAWDVTTGTASTIVAVVDTGINVHPELAGRVLAGYDFVNNRATVVDDNGHGTSCAGIIGAAGNNGIGVAGMSWNTQLLPVKVLDSTGSGYTSTIAQGVQWAADHGARVISMSLGGTGSDTTFANAINYAYGKGCIVVAAAGNSASSSLFYPAAYPNVLAVSALDVNGTSRASFSNYGSYIDVAAPGVNIYTITAPGGYTSTFTGTSAAAPFVSGLAALVLAANPGLSAAQVSSDMTSTADDLGTAGWDTSFGWGRIDAAKAVSAAAGIQPPPPPPPPPADTIAPTCSITSPTNGSTVSGSVTVRASASDNVKVTRVEFYVDGVRQSSTTTSPYRFTWSTRSAANGSHVLTVKAYDAAGNVGTSAGVTVRVSNRGH